MKDEIEKSAERRAQSAESRENIKIKYEK